MDGSSSLCSQNLWVLTMCNFESHCLWRRIGESRLGTEVSRVQLQFQHTTNFLPQPSARMSQREVALPQGMWSLGWETVVDETIEPQASENLCTLRMLS